MNYDEEEMDMRESDVYLPETDFLYDEELEDDELRMEEEAFMRGYVAA